jgi:hypothetical protein
MDSRCSPKHVHPTHGLDQIASFLRRSRRSRLIRLDRLFAWLDEPIRRYVVRRHIRLILLACWSAGGGAFVGASQRPCPIQIGQHMKSGRSEEGSEIQPFPLDS